MNNIKTFRSPDRFTKLDWNLFSGSIRFSDGSDPYISEYTPSEGTDLGYESLIMVGDPTGLSVYFQDQSGSTCMFKAWNLEEEAPSGIISLVRFSILGFMTTLLGQPYNSATEYLTSKGFTTILG